MVLPDKFICIIPVRYESSRFPGKPLAKINGKAMISIVYGNAIKAKTLEKVIVATDDKRIYDYCVENKFEVVYTSPDCKNGSERVAEVAEKIKEDYIFEMQGDQPLVTSDVIDDFINHSKKIIENDSRVEVVIPYSEYDGDSKDVLKVVVTKKEKLVFQSRQAIQTGFRTLGLYMWNKESLLRFTSLPVSRLEKAEDSHPIRLYVNDFVVQGVKIFKKDWIEVDLSLIHI